MNFLEKAVTHRGLIAQKNAPAVLFGVGIAGFVGTTVLACRATLKLEDVLQRAQSDLNIAKKLEDDDYSEKDRQKDITLIYVQNSVRVARLYAPAIVLGAASIACLTKSHNILSQRNAALTAAYVALEHGFESYRKRVVDKYGEEEDRDFRYGTEITEVVDPETKKKSTIKRVGPDGSSIYARFFDQYSPSWSKEPEYNLIFLKCQQNYANDLLMSRGHVFLNEVYDILGIPRSQAGAIIGWVLTGDGSTDNYINFGIFDDNDSAIDFVNGREGSVLLDFNVDGIIFDKIDRNREEISWQKGM
jgi:hypothetical protein